MIVEYCLLDNSAITLIDLYAIRESHCGPQHTLLMEKHLPKGNKLELLKHLLQAEGKEV